MTRMPALFFTALSLLFSPLAYAGLLTDQAIVIDGHTRTYNLYVPEATPNTPRPLVLLLHGHFGDADSMTGKRLRRSAYKIWPKIAEREGWILVIPNGSIGPDGYRGWNDCRADAETNPDTDDVKFLNALVDSVAQQYPVNPQRIYVNGTSNGGNMAFRLAQESGDKYRAIAAIVASMPQKNKCTPVNTPVSVLVMNGTEDPLLPYQGGGVGKDTSDNKDRGTVLSTRKTIDYWIGVNAITGAPNRKDLPDISKRDKSTVHIEQHRNEDTAMEVTLYEVRGGGHTEPSLSEHHRRFYKLIVGHQNRDMEMAEHVWSFFERNP